LAEHGASIGTPKRTSSHANRARVAAALGKWMDEGAKKPKKVYGKRWPGMKADPKKGKE